MRQVCFRLPDGAAAPGPAGGQARLGPIRLGSRQAEALSEVLQVFACGEESAALAFGHLARGRAGEAAQGALAVIADEEAAHEALLRGLRERLPDPAPDRASRKALIRFYHGLAHDDVGCHLGGIAALDSGVCVILSALLRNKAPLTHEPTASAVFTRIWREEAGHVRLSRRLARELSGREPLGAMAERTRRGLVDVLARHGAAFDVLGTDPDRLFADLRRCPPGLFM